MAKKMKISTQTKQLALAAVVVILIIYFIRKSLKIKEQTDIEKSLNTDGTPNNVAAANKPSWKSRYDALPSLGGSGVLQKGVKAKEVWSMQHYYNDRIASKEGRSKIDVDGVFGNQTLAALHYTTWKKRNSTTLTGWDYLTNLSKKDRYNHLHPTLAQNKPNSSSDMYAPYMNGSI
jgi:hypothetical protein